MKQEKKNTLQLFLSPCLCVGYSRLCVRDRGVDVGDRIQGAQTMHGEEASVRGVGSGERLHSRRTQRGREDVDVVDDMRVA